MKDFKLIQLNSEEEEVTSFLLVKKEDYDYTNHLLFFLCEEYDFEEDGYFLPYVEENLKKQNIEFQMFPTANRIFEY